jgi:hypothetical protein
VRREHLTDALVLLAVTACAFAVRAWHVGEPSLWWDELIEVITASRALPDVLREVRLGIPPGFGNTGAMPLDYVLLHFHLALVPMPAPEHLEAYYRFPSLLWSVATVAVVYALCRNLFDRTVALVASLWLAFSVAHVLYAAEVRFYSLMTLMTVLQLWAFATVVARPTVRSWTVYAAVNVLYLLTGLFGAFALVWQYLVFLGGAWRRRERGWVLALLGTGLIAASVPVLWWGPNTLMVQATRSGADAYSWKVVARQATDYFTQKTPFLEVAFAIAIPAMLLTAWRRSRATLPLVVYLALSCLAIPVIAFFVRSKDYYFHPRHALFLLPLVGIVTAVGFTDLLRGLFARRFESARTRETVVAGVACALILAAQLPTAWQFLRAPAPFFAEIKTMNDWKGVMERIAPTARAMPDGKLALIAERASATNAIGWHYLRWWGLHPYVTFWGYAGDWGTLARTVATDGASTNPTALALKVPVGLNEDFRRLLGIDPPVPTWPPHVGAWALVAFQAFPPSVAAAGWAVDRRVGIELALPPAPVHARGRYGASARTLPGAGVPVKISGNGSPVPTKTCPRSTAGPLADFPMVTAASCAPVAAFSAYSVPAWYVSK